MISAIDQMYAAATLLDRRECKYAVAGGIAAAIYRTQPRATFDVDFLVIAKSNTEAVASDILIDLSLVPVFVKENTLTRQPAMNKKRKPNVIIVGRDKDNPDEIGVDFLLPTLPWAEDALQRAEYNKIDFGKGALPTITVEDLIIAKIFAGRLKDLDDLESIFQANHPLDMPYLTGKIQQHELRLPLELRKCSPKEIRIAAKKH